ncbi:hypothetical protein [Marinobacterium jannaschii]|uniref:hypothetical protein n=1 Tax=Marinobacterium jannaschii TaxID=64970 RepID=UPI0012EB19B7|nr:hypothetical protein [Marinobacterium jannaschii]
MEEGWEAVEIALSPAQKLSRISANLYSRVPTWSALLVMKFLKIDTYEKDERDASIRIPLALLKVAARLFPRKHLTSLEAHAISFEDLLQIASSPEVSGTLIEIEDHRSAERLVISVE